MSYSCKYDKEFSEIDLKNLCFASGVVIPFVDNYQIFKNLAFFESFGQFGNANLYTDKDWVKVIEDPSFALLGSKAEVADNTCQIYTNVNYVIMYAEMGFKENAKRYIVQVQKSSTPEEWKFNKKSTREKQAFSLNVSFQFIKVDLSDAQKINKLQKAKDEALEVYRWDLWYPFIIRSTSGASYLAAAMGLSVGTLLF